MHRGRVADALLPQIAIEQRASILIISEQYSTRTDGQWFEDCTGTAAIWIPNESIIKPLSNGGGNGFVWIQLNDCFILSCYLTPSDNMDEFQSKMNAIEDEMRQIGERFIVAGDFNSRAVEWGSCTTNTRGRRILEMAARTGLTVANIGRTPTFKRPGCEGTIPDITLVSEVLASRITNWRVLDIYTGSDHHYISYSLRTHREMQRQMTGGTNRWNTKRLDTVVLISEIDRMEYRRHSEAGSIVDHTMKTIIRACNKAMPKIKTGNRERSAVYWWNDSIAVLRRNCLRQRRRYTRAKRRGTAESERMEYKEAQKLLRKAINNSKKDKWEKLRNDINRDPWGLGYKIVMKKLGSKKPTGAMDEEIMDNIVNTLFPTHPPRLDDLDNVTTSGLRLFTEQELEAAAARLKANKAPGPDGIPVEVLKEIVNKRPRFLLNMYNSCLMDGVFPDSWKEQKLVLIAKGRGEPHDPSSYRPLCMLNTAGKLLEGLLKPRIQEAININGGLSDRQHGFRPGKSTIGALKDVINVVLEARKQNHHSRPIVLLATLDVKNAFNSLRWSDVLHALKQNFNVPDYLMRMVRSYFRNRTLIYNTIQGSKRIQVTSGAAQGSILGPELWNASYDFILRMDMPEGSFLVGYADDIAAVIQARTIEEAQRRLNQVMIRARSWLQSHGLELATHKTELLLMTGRRIPTGINMRVNDVVISTKSTVNYLGIRLDTKLTFSCHIQHSINKAAEITANLSRLMANVGGPLAKRRKLLMEACNSILLYGCEIWGTSLRARTRARRLISVQTTAALRVTSAYRTVSAAAVQVISGMVPIDLQVEERIKFYEARQTGQLSSVHCKRIKLETLEKWQNRWDEERYGRWTARLIPHIWPWTRRKYGEVNYYLTQMLSGHGYFRKYLYRMNKCSSPYCIYEERECVDDAEHTFFQCIRWRDEREAIVRRIGPITPDNVVEKMLLEEQNWLVMASYCENLLRSKKIDLDNTRITELEAMNGGD